MDMGNSCSSSSSIQICLQMVFNKTFAKEDIDNKELHWFFITSTTAEISEFLYLQYILIRGSDVKG